jgi:undecaprenyl diphosphate synthase
MSTAMNPIPRHIAIIPDGNRRWAESHGLKAFLGHEQGTKQFRTIAEAAFESGVEVLTFWAASIDNLQKRSKLEINYLLKYFKQYLQDPETLEYFLKHDIRFRVIGVWAEKITDTVLAKAVSSIEKLTEHCKTRQLTILFGYDGQREMLEAINSLTQSKQTATPENLQSKLWTGFLPNVDLVIRTGGEPHWSAGFLMWLTANSQFYFTDIFWPDFSEKRLSAAIKDFSQRGRRFGK